MSDTQSQDAMARRLAAKTEEQKKTEEQRRLDEERKRKGYDDEGDTTVSQAVPMA